MMLTEKCNKILKITFNNPEKKNAFNVKSYDELGRVFRTVAEDDSINIVVITGVGNFFSSGNDLSLALADEDILGGLLKGCQIFKELVSAIIDCPKITIALVNGPAIGMGTTIAALCDMVWCADHAYFLTPFTKLGLVPEACSSYLLPLILGRSKATEMLLFSEKMTANEALGTNFVSKVFQLTDLETVIWPKIKEYSELPQMSMMVTKKLLRAPEKDALFKALNAECDELIKRCSSEEFANAVMNFAMRKSKSNSKL